MDCGNQIGFEASFASLSSFVIIICVHRSALEVSICTVFATSYMAQWFLHDVAAE